MADTLFSPGTVIQPSWLNDVNTNTYAVLSAVSAGPNNLTANAASTVVVGYPRGVAFRFIPQATNTGPMTINISGLGVRNITKYGAVPLVAGDVVIGAWAYIAYDGVQFQLINPLSVPTNVTGRLLNVQRLTVSGNYAPTPGTTAIRVMGMGASGGSGGAPAAPAGSFAFGTSGGAGAYFEHYATAGFAGLPFVIGAAGTAGGLGTAGGAGGATTFLGCSAGGGAAGQAIPAVAAGVTGPALGGVASGANILNVDGERGAGLAWAFAAFGPVTPPGPSTIWGTGGGLTGGNSPALAGTGFGAAGGWAMSVNGAAAQLGVAGRPGLLLVYEFS